MDGRLPRVRPPAALDHPARSVRPPSTRRPAVGSGSARGAAGQDRRGECHAMVLSPGRAQRRPGAAEHLVGSSTEEARCLALHILGVIEMDVPTACAGTLSQHPPVHDGVGTGFVGCATLDGDVVGKVERPSSQRHRDNRLRHRCCELVQRSRRRSHRGRSHLRHERRCSSVVERLALVVDRCRRHAGFDQLDPLAVHDLVVGRCSDCHGPAEMMSDTDTHAVEYPASLRVARSCGRCSHLGSG